MDILKRVLRRDEFTCGTSGDGACGGGVGKDRENTLYMNTENNSNKRGGVRVHAATKRVKSSSCSTSKKNAAMVWSSVSLLAISVIMLYVLLGLIVTPCNTNFKNGITTYSYLYKY